MSDSDDEPRASMAADKGLAARSGSRTSQEHAKDYLAGKERRLSDLEAIKRESGSGALRGTISEGITAVERDIENIKQEISKLKPGISSKIDLPV